MFEPAAGPVIDQVWSVKSSRKFQLWSVLSLQGQVNRLWTSFELVGDSRIDACVLVLNQYVTLECNQSIFMIKTRNYSLYIFILI